MAKNTEHAAQLRNNIVLEVRDYIESGTGSPKLYLQTAATATAATLVFNDPVGDPATPTGAVLTFDNTPTIEDTDATGNGSPVTKFEIRRGDGTTVCLTGTVGTDTGTADIALSSTTISATDRVQVTSLTYTAPV